MNKSEIGWKRINEDGIKIQVFARHVGDQWLFFWRERRFDNWQPCPKPPLEDWMQLLDAIQRRVDRRLLRPEAEKKVKDVIRERFPDTLIP